MSEPAPHEGGTPYWDNDRQCWAASCDCGFQVLADTPATAEGDVDEHVDDAAEFLTQI